MTHLTMSDARKQMHCQHSNQFEAYQVEREPIVGEDNDKKHHIHTKVQHVCQELQIEDIHSLHDKTDKTRLSHCEISLHKHLHTDKIHQAYLPCSPICPQNGCLSMIGHT